MRRYLFRRILLLIPVLWGVATAVFFTLRLMPGDPVDWMLGESARLADREALREQLGFHLPLGTQYGHFLLNLVRLDWGVSYFSSRQTLALIAERLPATVTLGLFALFIALSLALPLGTWAAVRSQTSVDRGAMFFSLLGISMPSFWLGPLLILTFAIHLPWFPPSGRQSFLSYILPALTLGMPMAALTARMVRSSMLEVLKQEYVLTARAKGVPEFLVLMRHAFKNSLIPVVTLVGLQCGVLLSGAIVTEKIFSWPGMGSLLLQAIERRDFSVIEACVLVFAMGYVVINTTTDLLYVWIDPRLRRAFSQEGFFQ